MADFNEAYSLTAAHEGGYVDDPIDRGGETYRGISRVQHPGWSGWKRVDSHKQRAGFPASLDADSTLTANVKSFYKRNYWDRFLGDQVPDQKVANELFDTGVKMEVRRAVRFLQTALNQLNRNQASYKDLVIDGWLGQGSLKALKQYLKQDRRPDILLKMLNIQQGARYMEIMANDPAQEKYARGWLKRA